MFDIIGLMLESLAYTSHHNLLESSSGLLYTRNWSWQRTQPTSLRDRDLRKGSAFYFLVLPGAHVRKAQSTAAAAAAAAAARCCSPDLAGLSAALESWG